MLFKITTGENWEMFNCNGIGIKFKKSWMWVLLIGLLALTQESFAQDFRLILDGLTRASTDGSNTAIALDSKGNPVIAYYDSQNGSLKVMICQRPSCRGKNTLAVLDTGLGNSGTHLSLVLDSDDNPVISYVAGADGMKLLRCGNPTCTKDNTLNSVGFNAHSYNSLKLDANGNPVIAYHAGSAISLVHCDDPNCEGDNQPIITGIPFNLGTEGEFASLELDASGNPVIAYFDRGDRTDGDGGRGPDDLNLNIAHCVDPDCVLPVFVTSPDTQGNAGQFISLKLDASGNPVVSYWQNGRLTLLHCDDPNCEGNERAAGNVHYVDEFGTGFYTSLQLDENGFPVISYAQGAINRLTDLKLVHCGDDKCSANNSIVVLDDGQRSGKSGHFKDFVGAWGALVLDAQGNPIVSYQNVSDKTLNLITCDDSNCAD